MSLAGLATPAAASGMPARRTARRHWCRSGWTARRSGARRNADGTQVRLLAALAGPDAAASVVAAQAEVGEKTNEVPVAAVVLGRLDLHGKVVTADALHTVKATARLIREGGGEFVLPVKENRRALFDAIDALPWRPGPDRACRHRQGPRADHHPHDPGPARPRRAAVPARQPGIPHRAVRHRPARQAGLGRRRARRRQPGTRAGRRRRPGPLRPGAMVDRVPALDPRHPLPGRQVPGQDPLRPQGHGCPPQPRDRRTPPGRAHRRHRGHPMGRTLHGPPFTILGLTS